MKKNRHKIRCIDCVHYGYKRSDCDAESTVNPRSLSEDEIYEYRNKESCKNYKSV